MDLIAPKADDAAEMIALIKDCPPLEPNTTYAYLLFCTHFADTCVLAKNGANLDGAVLAYRPPTHPEAVFVWQIAVHERSRGTGLGLTMLNALAERLAPHGVTHLEATVAPSNTASDRLFRKFAERRNLACIVTPCFEDRHFGGEEHEPELLYRIGPF